MDECSGSPEPEVITDRDYVKDMNVDWSRASDLFWACTDTNSGVLKYLFDYGRRDLPLLKRKLKRLNKKLNRDTDFDPSSVSDESGRRNLVRIYELFSEIASHVHVATVSFSKPGMRKFFVRGIGKHTLSNKERKHACIIEVLKIAQSQDIEQNVQALLWQQKESCSLSNQGSTYDGSGILSREPEGERNAWAHASIADTNIRGGLVRNQLPSKTSAHAMLTKSVHLKGTEIFICVGNLTKETTDAILVINQTDLNLSNGGELNRKILKAAGPILQTECESLVMENGAQQVGSAVMTDAGFLPCKHVIHVIYSSSLQQVGELQFGIKTALQLADSRSLVSISLPAVGAGGMGLSWRISAQFLSRGILSFLECPPRTLRQIRIVLFKRQMFATFSKELSDECMPVLTLEEYSPLFRQTSDDENEVNPADLCPGREQGNTVDRGDRAVNKEAFAVRIYGKDQKSILKAASGLQAYYALNSADQKITHDMVPQLLQNTCTWNRLRDIAQHCNVTLEPESNKNSITLCGNPDDVSSVVMRIWEEINACAVNQSLLKKRQLLSKYVCWSFVILDLPIACSMRVNCILEEAYSQQYNDVSFRLSNKEFKANFTNMTIISGHGNCQSVPLIRKHHGESGLFLPCSWEAHPYIEGDESPVHLVSLDNTSSEYVTVADMFYGTGGKGDLVKIERVQNRYLYRQYTLYKEEMERENSRVSVKLNELQLFHGTKGGNVNSINRQGFNRSFSGSNGAMYGNGVYFARNASYSMSYTSAVCGERQMYLARVLVGLYTMGCKGLRIPPPRDPLIPEVLYDSVVDNVLNPSLFVVFRDAQCYPEYLLTFKSRT